MFIVWIAVYCELTATDSLCVEIKEYYLKKHHFDSTFVIPGYTLFRRDRKGRKGGGVAVYSKDNMNSQIVTTIVDDREEYEALWVRARCGDRDFYFCAVYHPPRPLYDTSLFKAYLTMNIDNLMSFEPSASIVIGGDFNQITNDEVCLDTGLISLISTPTRGNSILDKVFVSGDISPYFSVKVIKSTVKTDHSTIFISNGDVIINRVKCKRVVNYRSKAPSQHAAFLLNARNITFSDVYDSGNAQDCADRFYSTVNFLLDTYYPIKTVTLTDKDPQYITPEVKTLLRRKNVLMHQGKFEEASSLALKIGKLITRHNASKLSHINPKTGTGDLWEEVRRLTSCKTRKQTCPPNITSSMLNAHYANVSNDPNYSPPSPKYTCSSPSSQVSEFEVFRLLDNLRPTATGPDNIPFWFLRVAAPILSAPLTFLVNLSFTQSKVPLQWKSAIIHPVPKIPNPTTASDLRPISVLPVLSRLTERVLVRNFIQPAMLHVPPPLRIDNQFAYRPTSSTTGALIAILDKISELLKSNDYVFCVTFDYSKAFDTLSHSSVASKLAKLDLPDNAYNWVIDYLEGRNHCTILDGKSSSLLTINASVVQGSVLGPNLFNINSTELITKSAQNFYFKYADDAYLIVPSSNLHTLNDELSHHETWAKSCNLKFNANKTAEIVFRARAKLPEPPANLGVQRVPSIKVLGVLMDNKLNFQEHVSTTIAACSSSLFALRVTRQYGLSEEMLQNVFKVAVLSKLMYASPAWSGFMSKSLLDRFEAFLRRAVKFGYYKTSDPKASDLLLKADLGLFNKILHNEHHVLNFLLPPHKKTKY